jgi:threonine dehydrogenase-like Zn-dependent dehydrogenase
MRGVTFLGERKLQLAEFSDPVPGAREVIVEIKASGMCGSDLKFYRAAGGTVALGLGRISGPVIAGHEPCGIVAALGANVAERAARIGARVMCITTPVAAPVLIALPAGRRCAWRAALSMG